MAEPTIEQLKEYRRKRDFRRTPEPSGESGIATAGHLYVMHKHAASHDHFDLRLEHEGVLKSWALPKGPSLEAGEKRLAVEVEDHPLEYASFEGVIPKEEYGGGTIMLWDAGSWSVIGKHDKDQIDFRLDGEKLKGSWTLVRTRGKGKRAKPGKSWLLIKRTDKPKRRLKPDERSVLSGRTMKDIARDPEEVWTSSTREDVSVPAAEDMATAQRAALPKTLQPQLATLTDKAPEGGNWLHEIKHDGYRIVARFEKGRVQLFTRNGHDWTRRFSSVAKALEALRVDDAMLDGEVTILDADGSSSFRRLQEALSAGRSAGFVYLAFDLLHLDGHDLRKSEQLERKRVLRQLLKASGFGSDSSVRYSDHIVGNGPEFYEQACELGLEGIISKRSDGVYRSGRGKQWLKVKCTHHEEFVVGGYTEPGGSRSGFGSLLLGAYEKDNFVYAGRVGTGFSNSQIEQLHRKLRDNEVDSSPFNEPPDVKQVHWVKPEFVVEVEFTERTRDGRLRHPVFRGLREDREPGEIEMTGAVDMQETAAHAGEASSRPQRAPGEARVAGVRLTHPDKVMYPEQGATKLDLARYYEDIQDWVLPQLANRPLTLVRCPEGRHKECFYQKHLAKSQAKNVARVGFRESRGVKEYAYVRNIADVVSLVQAGVLEFHPFGSQVGDVEHPDVMVFDLDPSPGVAWSEMLRTARDLRSRLEDLGLGTFLRTTGGKGLHIVVPLEPQADWDTVKTFAQTVAEQHAQENPQHLTTNMSKQKRRGKILIDYLRNARGSTAIASYSARAREGAPIAVPVRWDELSPALRGDRYKLHNIRRRLAALKEDPWQDFIAARKPLTDKLCKSIGMKQR